MKLKTRLLCGIFGFYLTLAFLLPQFAAVIFGYCFNKGEIIARVCTEANAVAARQDIISACDEIADPCGIPLTVYETVFTVARVKRDMKQGLLYALDFETYTPDTASMEKALAEKVREIILAEEETEVLEEETEADITDFCTQSMTYYKKRISLSAYRYFRGLYNRFLKAAILLLGIFAILTAIALFFLIRLLRQAGAVINELTYALFASGVCNALFAIAVQKEDFFADIQMSPVYFRDAVRSFLNGAVRADFTVGCVTAAAGVLLFLVLCVTSLKKRRASPLQEEEKRV